jgi:uncharacterized protein (TIGR01777 family)
MKKLKIVIAGGKGFLGGHLEKHFTSLGYQVVILSRSKPSNNCVWWDAKTLGSWATELEGAAVLINMAGRTVDCRYTEANKREILNSRVDSTRILGVAMAACKMPPKVWVNSSTATIYAHTIADEPANTELDGVLGTGFSVGIATAWEKAFWAEKLLHTRRIALRASIVFGEDGGAFPVMAKLAKVGLCGPQGNGNQWISWIHVDDFCRAVEFLVTQTQEQGAINICAPNPIQNKDFNALLKRELRPVLCLSQPKWLLEIGAFVIRTQTELILKSRKVYPQRLLDLGFTFCFAHCADAVKDLLPHHS